MYADVYNICLTYTPAHAWCWTPPVKCMYTLRKNAYGLVHAHLCNGHGAKPSLPLKLWWTYLESCASIVEAVFCRLPSRRLDEISCPKLCADIRPTPQRRQPVTKTHFRHFWCEFSQLYVRGGLDLGLTAFSFNILFLSDKKSKRCERKPQIISNIK